MLIERKIIAAISLQAAYVMSLLFNMYPALASLSLSILKIPNGEVKDGNFLFMTIAIWIAFSFITLITCSVLFFKLRYRWFVLAQFWSCFIISNVGYFSGWYMVQ